MATETEARPLGDVPSNTDTDGDAPPQKSPEQDGLKRKALEDRDEGSPKRIKHDDHFREATNERPRRVSSPSRRGSHSNSTNVDADRRRLATQEEKKRGKRLFGGLLSTLSQTTGSTQQKRRLEIERRQQDRLQKQKIVFEEKVMQNKHSKMLAMAQYLRTKSHPQIHYLPWKLTEAQETELDDQVRHAKATIERELEAFKARKERHTRESGQGRVSPSVAEAPVPTPMSEAPVDKPRSTNGSEYSARAVEREQHHGQQHHHHHHHHHDESADVLEEAEEDMCYYMVHPSDWDCWEIWQDTMRGIFAKLLVENLHVEQALRRRHF
ncbi:hypothetical protein NM208_g8223 [Fusarium decemcellulare]|uniref:Uncharacterized protein n=1 Tax=Fusarium decemcellulare TaxID=57161 RepID=A0ACC1S6Q2_9HYPO|nr:hypothetical protein NM208_g8223 [Fusarium decemcellulare]